jgi:hypothetical protein
MPPDSVCYTYTEGVDFLEMLCGNNNSVLKTYCYGGQISSYSVNCEDNKHGTFVVKEYSCGFSTL